MRPFKITQSITDRQDASLGIFLKEVSKIPLIDINEEIELSRKVKNGDIEAANKLVEANLRFVISVAKQYQNKGLPLVDLIQEGIIGARKASLLYDESKGYRFISYAVWWIRQAIMQAISSQCRTIRIPMNQVVCVNKINKASEKFEQTNGRKPTSEELASELSIDVSKVDLALSSINKAISLDSPFKDEDTSTLLDVIPNSNADISDELPIREDLSASIEEVLSKLSFRERDILRMSYGIGMAAMQNEEIASRFGIGCERVRQIQHEAIEKIRMNYIDDLKDLI